jgi:hypothetical protein
MVSFLIFKTTVKQSHDLINGKGVCPHKSNFSKGERE